MYILLIIFFISLAGITFLIGRKLMMIRKGVIIPTGEFLFTIPSLQEAGEMSVRGIKRLGYVTLVISIKFYVRSSNFLKNTHGKVRAKVQNITSKYAPLQNTEIEPKKASKFLKKISEYKNRIRKIQSKIKEEEGIE